MTGYIAAPNIFLLNQYSLCTGMVVHSSEQKAMLDSIRLHHTLSKNQWFKILIPDADSFLCLDIPMERQSSTVIDDLCSREALSMIFIAEGKEFLSKLDVYLQSINAHDDPEDAKIEVEAFYEEKKREILAMEPSDYLRFISEKTIDGDPAKVSAYLYGFGVSGLSFQSSFLLFNPHKDIIIKELRRSVLDNSRLAS
jgi:hypothetical protein